MSPNVISKPCLSADPASRAQKLEQRSHVVFAFFGLVMMALSLALPLVLAEKEMSFGLTVAQIVVWLGLSAAWILQGYWSERSGFGFNYRKETAADSDKRPRGREVALYLLGFGPLCYAYIYLTWLNTGYFGFNYILLFVVAGFSSLIFPLWGALLYLVYQGVAWLLLGYAMWGVWIKVEDTVSMFSGYLFSSMMFYVFRSERRSRSEAFALSMELDQANEKLRQTSRKIEELAATQERNRIAREIHDTIGHSLTVVNMQLETAKALIESDRGKAKAFLDKAQEVTRKGLSDIRASVASLRASPLDGASLARALENLLASSFSSDAQAVFLLKGDSAPLKPAAEAALYRSAQEALTNIRKHAEASQVRVELDLSDPKRVVLSVSDNGKGCQEVNGGFGIMGIRERIQLLDGRMELSSSPGNGLSLIVSVPR